MAEVKAKQTTSTKQRFRVVLVLITLTLLTIGIFNNDSKSTDSSNSDSPDGKSFVSVNTSKYYYTEIDLGNTNLGQDVLNWNKHLFDSNKNPTAVIQRKGTFTVDGNIVYCKFNDGQPPYKLQYKKNGADEDLVDENGEDYMR